jgi:hypothetical protein
MFFKTTETISTPSHAYHIGLMISPLTGLTSKSIHLMLGCLSLSLSHLLERWPFSSGMNLSEIDVRALSCGAI